MLRGWLIGKTEGVQRAIEPVAAAISGEHPSGAITAIGGRGKADNQKPRLWITETGERFCPICASAVTARWILRASFTPANQAGTPPALHHLCIQFLEPVCEIVDHHLSLDAVTCIH